MLIAGQKFVMEYEELTFVMLYIVLVKLSAS